MSESTRLIFSVTDPNDSKLLVRDLNPEAAQHFLTVNIEEGDALTEVTLDRAASFDLHSHVGNWLGKGDDLLEARNQLNSSLKLKDQQIEELEGELATEQKELRRAQNTITELTEQVEELQVSPLDLAQQQRAKALTMARDVVEETGSASVFHKSGSSKVSLAGVVSTAHFITSGERDYVTTDGEYVLDDTRRALPARDGTLTEIADEPERDGGRSKEQYVVWKSGVEEVITWVEENLTPGEDISTKWFGYVQLGELITEIRDHFANPTQGLADGE